jgi:DNA-directed RNA polymerase subunit beta'
MRSISSPEVDEAARERALHRLEEEYNREIARYTSQAEQGITAIDDALSTQGKEDEAREESIVEGIRARRDSAIDAIMSEATLLRQTLEKQLNDEADQDVTFGPTDTLIVSMGDKVTRAHLSTLNQFVQDELTRIETDYSTESDALLAPIEQESNAARVDAEGRRTQYQDSLEAKLEEIRVRFEDDRDELMSLKTKQLLPEGRYRELADKWGRAFKAAMGAEAIYTISADIDLESLSEELKDEIKTTTPSSARRRPPSACRSPRPCAGRATARSG